MCTHDKVKSTWAHYTQFDKAKAILLSSRWHHLSYWQNGGGSEYFKHFLLLSCQADCCSVALVDTDTERGSRGLHPCFAQNQGLYPPFSLKGGSQIHVQAYNNRLKNTQKCQMFGNIWLRNISLMYFMYSKLLLMSSVVPYPPPPPPLLPCTACNCSSSCSALHSIAHDTWHFGQQSRQHSSTHSSTLEGGGGGQLVVVNKVGHTPPLPFTIPVSTTE